MRSSSSGGSDSNGASDMIQLSGRSWCFRVSGLCCASHLILAGTQACQPRPSQRVHVRHARLDTRIHMHPLSATRAAYNKTYTHHTTTHSLPEYLHFSFPHRALTSRPNGHLCPSEARRRPTVPTNLEHLEAPLRAAVRNRPKRAYSSLQRENNLGGSICYSTPQHIAARSCLRAPCRPFRTTIRPLRQIPAHSICGNYAAQQI